MAADWAARPKEWEPLVQRIKERQNADGGWSQTKDMASDAWATGQALTPWPTRASSPTSRHRARQAFLIKTQRDDGSWPMTSRPTKPGGEGSKSLIPITGAGSAGRCSDWCGAAERLVQSDTVRSNGIRVAS